MPWTREKRGYCDKRRIGMAKNIQFHSARSVTENSIPNKRNFVIMVWKYNIETSLTESYITGLSILLIRILQWILNWYSAILCLLAELSLQFPPRVHRPENAKSCLIMNAALELTWCPNAACKVQLNRIPCLQYHAYPCISFLSVRSSLASLSSNTGWKQIGKYTVSIFCIRQNHVFRCNSDCNGYDDCVWWQDD